VVVGFAVVFAVGVALGFADGLAETFGVTFGVGEAAKATPCMSKAAKIAAPIALVLIPSTT
jgi:hypothetical protein